MLPTYASIAIPAESHLTHFFSEKGFCWQSRIDQVSRLSWLKMGNGWCWFEEFLRNLAKLAPILY